MSNDTQVKQEDNNRIAEVLQKHCRHAALLDSEEFIVNEANLRKALADLLATVRKEALKEAVAIIDKAGEEWGDAARARRSKTYSAYVIAALDLKGRIEAALEASANNESKNK